MEGFSSWPPFSTEHISSNYCGKRYPLQSNLVEFNQQVKIVVEEVLGWMYDLIASVYEMKLKIAWGRAGREDIQVIRAVRREGGKASFHESRGTKRSL